MAAVKQFVVFAYEYQYPSGGWDDFKASFDTIEEAKDEFDKLVTNGKYDAGDIVDLETGYTC